MMQEFKLNDLFDRLSKWSDYIPIGDYRYQGHPMDYTTNGSKENNRPSERQVLIFRFLRHKIVGRYYKFHLSNDRAWRYAMVNRVSHENSWSVYGCLNVTIYNPVNMEIERVELKMNEIVTYEEISLPQFERIVLIFGIES